MKRTEGFAGGGAAGVPMHLDGWQRSFAEPSCNCAIITMKLAWHKSRCAGNMREQVADACGGKFEMRVHRMLPIQDVKDIAGVGSGLGMRMVYKTEFRVAGFVMMPASVDYLDIIQSIPNSDANTRNDSLNGLSAGSALFFILLPAAYRDGFRSMKS